jgi:hypothetical protein
MAGLRPGHPFLILRDLWRCAKRQHRLDGRVEGPAMTKKGKLDGRVSALPSATPKHAGPAMTKMGSAVEPPLSASLRYAGHFPHGLRADAKNLAPTDAVARTGVFGLVAGTAFAMWTRTAKGSAPD